MVLLFVLYDNHLGNYLLLQEMKKENKYYDKKSKTEHFILVSKSWQEACFNFLMLFTFDNLNELK